MSVTAGTWNTASQIRDHKLACSIINFHGTPDEVFEHHLLDLLARFTASISVTARDEILKEHGWVDEPGARPGEKAVSKDGSLMGYLIARYGTQEPALDKRDWELLREWCGQGMPVGEHVER